MVGYDVRSLQSHAFPLPFHNLDRHVSHTDIQICPLYRIDAISKPMRCVIEFTNINSEVHMYKGAGMGFQITSSESDGMYILEQIASMPELKT